MPRYLVDSLQLKTNAPRDVIPPFPCRTKSNGNWFIAFLTASFKLLANSWQLCCKPPMVHDSSIILSVYRIQPKIAHWLNSQDHYLANVLLTYVTTFINKKPGSRKHSQPYCMTANYHLQLFSRYWALSVLRSRVWPFGVRWRHRSRDRLILHRPFPIGGPWYQASISNGFRDIQWWMWRNGWRDLKRPLNEGQGHSFW